ncbi:MAG TPA: hypothetical protein VGR02_11970 [Thermoanaerobaculia bacterium]|nr:hypothetical protein [Thermoanaerobaculia bacterium]
MQRNLKESLAAAILFLGCAHQAAASMPYRTIDGDIAIHAAGHSVVVSVDAITPLPRSHDIAAEVPDGVVEETITLRSEEEVAPLDLVLRRAHVEIATESVVIISSRERKMIILHLGDAQIDRELPADFAITRASGYELSLQPVDERAGRQLRAAPDAGPYDNDPGNGSGGSAANCVSGGAGSTSCSSGNGGCSVSCQNGYYACCNSIACHCYRNGT